MPQFSVVEIAERIGAQWRGDPRAEVTGIAALADAGPDELSFYTDRRYRQAARRSRAGAIIVAHELAELAPERMLVVDDARGALWKVLTLFYPDPSPTPLRHPTAQIAETARVAPTAHIEAFVTIGERATVGPYVSIGAGARIGNDVQIGAHSLIGPNAVVMDGVRIGQHVRIGPGSIIGNVGFGFAQVEGHARRMPHVGAVIIEDEVEIGANCTVDRALVGLTRIGRGSKIDSLVHVGHNVHIGEGVFVAAQCGFAGSAVIGDGVLIGGQAGVAEHVTVAPGSRIAAKSGVMKSLGGTVAGHPARSLMAQRRAEALLFHLGALLRRVHRLERILGVGRDRLR